LPGLNGEPDRVLKAIGDDRFMPTPVHLGARGHRYAEVLHGLALGDQVVAQGTFLLEAEANRAAELARLTPESDHSTMDHSTMDHGEASP
jgi:multidrug efflux pump subunit AcrA (membrane-fusion protein)